MKRLMCIVTRDILIMIRIVRTPLKYEEDLKIKLKGP